MGIPTGSTPLDRLKVLADIHGNEKDALLEEFLARAEDYILSYTFRDKLPDNSASWHAQLALIYLNRAGIEGESAHSEGGVSRSIETLPADLQAWLDAHRLTPGILRARREGA